MQIKTKKPIFIFFIKYLVRLQRRLLKSCKADKKHSFKWSIYDRKPLGITLHYIDAAVDAGEIIYIAPTNVYETDTLEILARRHYENEIDCMSAFDYYIENRKNLFKNIKKGKARMRMPLQKEKEMVSNFSEYVKIYSKEKTYV